MLAMMTHVHSVLYREHAWELVGIAVASVLLLLVASLYTYDARPGGPLDPKTIHLSSVEWYLGGNYLTAGGALDFKAGIHLTVTLSYQNSPFFGPLAVTNASTNTSGFAVVGSNLPRSVPSGEAGNFSVVLSTPDMDYSGPLAVELGG